MRSRLSMIMRPGDGRSDAPSTATERGWRSGLRSIGRPGSALMGRPPRAHTGSGDGAKRRSILERTLDVLQPMRRRVSGEVQRPFGGALAPAKPLVGRLLERL